MPGPPASLRGAVRAGARFLFPPQCMCCGEDVHDPRALCPECWQSLDLITGAVCDGCARPVPFAQQWGEGSLRCDECADTVFEWDKVRAAGFYTGTARALILALKHGDRADLARALGLWMVRAGQDVLSEADMLVPVPLHWHRRAARRMNQAAELSRFVSEFSGVKNGAGVLRRVQATKSLGTLDPLSRKNIVAGAFKTAGKKAAPVAGKRVVLIDDVMTSGATLSEAARTLKAGGAQSVDALIFARAARPLSEDGITD